MTAPHYGVRNPGGLTAASPGDTLHFQYASFNDSGDSEAQSGFAVTDIELFKNGIATARATDSGYSLISDTGQMGDRVGLNRFSVQLFNTSDDTGFFDAGSWYQVAVDGVTIDGKTVRFWAGSFEIGTPRANVIEINGDTGKAVHLGQMADEHDTGRLQAEASATLDTGAIHAAVWQVPSGNANRTLTNIDTGAALHIAQMADEHDTGRVQAEATATLDTGAVNQAVWQGDATRVLTANTNLSGLNVNVTSLADTGVNDRFASISTAIANADTGQTETLDRILADTDTGLKTGLTVTTSAISDTGVNERLTAIETKTASLTFTQAGVIDANILYVNSTQVTGTGDTGTGDTWRPA